MDKLRRRVVMGVRERGVRVIASLRLGFIPPPFDGMQTIGRMRFLFESVLQAKPSEGSALELGCYKAGSTVYLAKACRRKGIKQISAIDLFTGTQEWDQPFDTYEAACTRLKHYRLGDVVRLIRGHSLEVQWDTPLAVLHIDADHNYQAVKADSEKYVPMLVPGGIVFFDDYDAPHSGVMRAVHELLVANDDLEVVGVYHEGEVQGSICIRRRPTAA